MTEIALIVSFVALVIALVCLAATLELFAKYEGLETRFSGGSGAHTPVLLEEITKSLIARKPSQIGLDLPPGYESWYVLIVSTNCRTCSRVITELGNNPPFAMSVIVLGVDGADARDWLTGLGFDHEDRLIEPDSELFDKAGLIVTPSLLVVIDDELAFVVGVEAATAVHQVVVEKFVPPLALSIRAGVSRNEQQSTN